MQCKMNKEKHQTKNQLIASKNKIYSSYHASHVCKVCEIKSNYINYSKWNQEDECYT